MSAAFMARKSLAGRHAPYLNSRTKLLRAMNAADIGYSLECSGMAAATRAFNPRITTSNPKNLMKGDSYCIERFVLEG